MHEDFKRALEHFPAEPGNQIVRASLLAQRGELRFGEGWLVYLTGDELMLAGDPTCEQSTVEPVEVCYGLSCGCEAYSDIGSASGLCAALAALPAEDWQGFCKADPDWESSLESSFNKVVRQERIGFVGGATPPPDGKTRAITADDASAVAAIGEEWLWKRYASAREFCERSLATVALLDNEVRSVASVFTADERYADIAVATHPDYRARGLARNAVLALCQILNTKGLTPFWETAAGNTASRMIPEALRWKQIALKPLYYLNRQPR